MEEGWVRVKFADPLKSMMRSFYRACGIEDEHFIESRIEGVMKEEPDPFLCGRTPRRAMQTLGTEWGRDCIARDLWTRAWTQRVLSLLNRGMDVVADDCRFANEAEAVRALEGRVIRIIGRDRGIGAAHVSESPDFEPDMTIRNTSCLYDFTNYIIYVFDRTDAD